jgi:hypothetical protein
MAAHGFFSIDAHSDPSNVLSAADWSSRNPAPVPLTTADLPADLANGIGLTIGCHAGLNLSDTFVANPNPAEQAALLDWSQAILRNGGVLQAPTGYGLGEKTSLAYSARLLSDFAERLDGSMSLGQALMMAKQHFVEIGVPTVYDAKALEEATFYGLPMYRLGATGTQLASILPEEGAPPANLPAPGTTTATFDAQSAGLHEVDTADGSYFAVGDEAPQVTPNQPIEPSTAIPLTPPGPGLVAHDAVPEQMETYDIAGYDPVYATETAAGGAEVAVEPDITTAAFPSQLQQVSTSIGVGGVYQHSLVVMPGQFGTDGSGTGTGIQRVVTHAQYTVNWSASSDFDPPDITQVSGTVQNGVAQLRGCTSATDAVRGVILFLPTGGPNPQDWTHVELVDAGGGCWSGTANVGAGVQTIGQFNMTLCDRAGNCGHTSNKARNYSASALADSISFSIGATANQYGTYPDPTTIGVSVPPTMPVTVKIDGVAQPQCTTGPCQVTVTGDGGHTVAASAGGSTKTLAVPIDEHPPVVTVVSPTANQRVRQGTAVATRFSCTTALTLVGCAGPASLDTATAGDKVASFTGTDNLGRSTTVEVPYHVDGTAPALTLGSTPPQLSNEGQATFSWTAPDPDDPGATDVTFTCKLDSADPVACSSPTTVTVPSPIDGSHRFTVTATDRVGNSASAAFEWAIDTTAPMFQSFIGPADPTSQTTASFAYQVDDSVAGGGLTVTCTLDGAAVPCSATGASISGLSPRVSPYVFRVTARDGAGNTGSAEHQWHIYANTQVAAQGVLPSLPRLTATVTTTAGAPVANQVVLFTYGTGEMGAVVPCSGAEPGGGVRTNANGAATCNLTLGTLLAVVGSGGYTATFLSIPPYFGSQGRAGILG